MRSLDVPASEVRHPAVSGPLGRSRALAVETAEEIAGLARRAIELFGEERVLLTPDCGFATFADNPVASASIAEAKLRAIAPASAILHGSR